MSPQRRCSLSCSSFYSRPLQLGPFGQRVSKIQYNHTIRISLSLNLFLPLSVSVARRCWQLFLIFCDFCAQQHPNREPGELRVKRDTSGCVDVPVKRRTWPLYTCPDRHLASISHIHHHHQHHRCA